jgi:hypothetical protein
MEVQLAHHLLEAEIVRSARGFDLEPRRFPLRERLGAVTPHYLIKSLWHLVDRPAEKPSSLGNLH